jgi:D-alanine-D-alanine ligase
MNTNSKNKNIGVFFGSGSPEHDVSIITGELIIGGLKKLGYQVTPVYITKTGKWMLGEDLGDIKLFSDPSFAKASEGKPSYARYYLDMEESVGKMVFRKKGLIGKSIIVDLAFPALHGSYGEDGTIQGLFEMFGIPYVGCDVPSSAVSMDKALTKIMMRDAGIATTKFVHFLKSDWEKDKQTIISRVQKELTWPVFIKPVHLGSSIGIAKVKPGDDKDLEFRIEVALHYDNKVLVEEGVENVMDVTCCVIGNDVLTPSVLQESVFFSDLFDFNEKYLKEGGAQLGNAQSGLQIPARLDAVTTSAIQNTAKDVYRALGCSGIARVDFLVDKTSNKFFANEVNPLPGTLYHHLWKASGVELGQLLQKLITFAQEKYEQKRSVTFTFESNILKQLGSKKFGSKKLL